MTVAGAGAGASASANAEQARTMLSRLLQTSTAHTLADFRQGVRYGEGHEHAQGLSMVARQRRERTMVLCTRALARCCLLAADSTNSCELTAGGSGEDGLVGGGAGLLSPLLSLLHESDAVKPADL